MQVKNVGESRTVTFRVVGVFQYMENYAVHDWDGTGTCPDGWKMKGSVEILVADGLTADMICDADFMAILEERVKEVGNVDNDYVRQYFITLDVEISGTVTYREMVDAYCDFGINLVEGEMVSFDPDACKGEEGVDKYECYDVW